MTFVIEQKPSPNTDNVSFNPRGITLHTTLGNFNGAVDWLRTSPEERKRKTGVKTYSSAHFVIGRLGEIAQLIPLDKRAWHAGRVSKPTELGKAALKPSIVGYQNPNNYMFGLEFASGYDIDRDGILESWERLFTPHQIKAAVFLKNHIEEALNIEIPERYIITHHDTDSSKPNITAARLMVLSELRKQEQPQPTPPPTPGLGLLNGDRIEIIDIKANGEFTARKVA